MNGESVAGEEHAGLGDLGDSSLHKKESDVNKEDSAEKIEVSQPRSRRSGCVRRMPVRFHDTVMVDVKDPLEYEGAMCVQGEGRSKLALKQELDYIERGNSWT